MPPLANVRQGPKHRIAARPLVRRYSDSARYRQLSFDTASDAAGATNRVKCTPWRRDSTCILGLKWENRTQVIASFGLADANGEWTVVDSRTIAEVLAKLRFTETLPADVLERLAALAVLRGYPAHSVVFREGTQNDDMMIVAIGSLALEMHVPGRGNVRILSVGPGDMVAWSALVGSRRMTTSAVALEDTQVVCLPAAEVLEICQADPTFGYDLMSKVAHALADRLVATRLQLLDLFADTAPALPRGPD